MSVINPANGGRIDYPIDCEPIVDDPNFGTESGSILDYPKNEYTRENTIGDPYVSEPRLVKTPWSTLKSIFKWYLIACGIIVNIVQLIMWIR